MAVNEELLKKARTAGSDLEEAERRVQSARTEYHTIVRRIHLAGSSLREIAQALDLSHQRVQQMVNLAGGSWWQKVWSSRNRKGDLACTFCGRNEDLVESLIAGPKVYICGDCVAAAERNLSRVSERSRIRCSFCGKRHSSERQVLSGPSANVCSECLVTCRQIVADSTAV